MTEQVKSLSKLAEELAEIGEITLAIQAEVRRADSFSNAVRVLEDAEEGVVDVAPDIREEFWHDIKAYAIPALEGAMGEAGEELERLRQRRGQLRA
jgi:hypothetical protein